MVREENGWVIDQTTGAIYLQEELNIQLLLSVKVNDGMVCFKMGREETVEEGNHVPDTEGSPGRADYARFAIRRERVVRSCQKFHHGTGNTKGKGAAQKHKERRDEKIAEKKRQRAEEKF